MTTSIQCPYCDSHASEVTDSRATQGGSVMRRRRQCGGGHRWTTVEIPIEQFNALRRYQKLIDTFTRALGNPQTISSNPKKE